MTRRPSILRDPDAAERVPFVQLLPNMVTLAGMCFGLTSVRYSMDERFGTAVLLIMLAALMDGLDGLLARRLNAASKLGSELDSLSDFLCFGVAPGILLYQAHLSQLGNLGWIFVLVLATATCLRLARFNVLRGVQDSGEEKAHFVGVPAPGGALLALLPVFLVLSETTDYSDAPLLVGLWVAFVGLLMISTLKTLSPKGLRVPRKLIAVIIFAMVIVIGMVFTRPWTLLVVIDLAYLAILSRSLVQARGRFFN
jgi:CDP-diacylglycerol--serine O-phosphatidyltransferase